MDSKDLIEVWDTSGGQQEPELHPTLPASGLFPLVTSPGGHPGGVGPDQS